VCLCLQAEPRSALRDQLLEGVLGATAAPGGRLSLLLGEDLVLERAEPTVPTIELLERYPRMVVLTNVNGRYMLEDREYLRGDTANRPVRLPDGTVIEYPEVRWATEFGPCARVYTGGTIAWIPLEGLEILLRG